MGLKTATYVKTAQGAANSILKPSSPTASDNYPKTPYTWLRFLPTVFHFFICLGRHCNSKGRMASNKKLQSQQTRWGRDTPDVLQFTAAFYRLISWETVSFSRRSVLRGVCHLFMIACSVMPPGMSNRKDW
jgi:hypothetical protein